MRAERRMRGPREGVGGHSFQGRSKVRDMKHPGVRNTVGSRQASRQAGGEAGRQR